MILSKKKLLVITLVVLSLLCLALGACVPKTPDGGDDEAPEMLKLNPNTISLYVGNTAKSDVIGLEEGETVIGWLSNNEAVATVDSNGIITAVAPGQTTIRATSSNERIALVKVTVLDNSFLLIPSIKLNETVLNLIVGSEYVLQPQLTYGGQAVNGTISWTTSNSGVATVNDGIITAVGEGSASVVCQATYEGQSVTAAVDVAVTPSGTYFCADYANLEIWQGDVIELSVSQTIDGETTTVPNVTFKSSKVNVADISYGKLTAKTGGDAVVTASFEHEGTPYEIKTTVHVYGKNTVTVYALGSKDQTIRGKMYGDKITLELKKPIENRAVKCWYVNGEKIEGNTFIMPDEKVEVRAIFVNETEGDFTTKFTEGKLLQGQAEAIFTKDVKVDSANAKNTDGNYVVLSNAASGGSSLQFNLDEGIAITSNSSVVFRVFVPNDSVQLFFGVGNTIKRTYSVDGSTDFTLPNGSGRWTEIKIPLTTFGAENTLLNSVSIGLTGSMVYVDYVMFIY